MTRPIGVRSLLALLMAASVIGCGQTGPPSQEASDFAAERQRIENDASIPLIAKQTALKNLERQQSQQQH